MRSDGREEPVETHPAASTLAAVVERASVAIGLHDLDGRCLLVNETMAQLNRRSSEDTVGRTPAEYLPEMWPQLQPLFERAATEPVLGVELDGETPAHPGERRWYRCDLWPVPNGEDTAIAVMVTDVTDRRRAVHALRQSEARFRAMADDVPLIVWLHDETGAQRFVNQTFCDYFGLRRDAIGTDDWKIMLHPDGADDYVAAFATAVEQRAMFHAEVRVRSAGGEWRWMESWGRPRFDDDGVYLGHVGTSADVTDRIVAQQAVRDAAEFTGRVLDNLNAFVGVLDTDGVLLDCNEAPLTVAGITRDDVVGLPFWDCHWWNDSPEKQEVLRRAVAAALGGEVVRYDVAVRAIGDRHVWIDFQIAPLRDSKGHITHLIPSGMDISDRKAAELERAELLANEQQARHRAEVLEQNATLLAAAATVDDVAVAVVEHLCATLDLAAVRVLALVDDGRLDADRLDARSGTDRLDGGQLLRVFGALGERVGEMPVQHLGTQRPGAYAIRSNEAVHLRHRAEVDAWFAGEAGDDPGVRGVEAMLALPLRSADRRAIGALVVAVSDQDGLEHGALALLHELAGQTGLALERVRLLTRLVDAHRQEHEIASRLQRALLPDRIVEHPSVVVAARYRAAGDLLAVGGDWYDSYLWPGGGGVGDDGTSDREGTGAVQGMAGADLDARHVGFVVGDVVGHDLEAAAAMGRLRSATAALVPIGAPSPGAILDALTRSAEGPANVDFVTAAAVVIDTITGDVRYSTAGHPPPLLVRPDGSTVWLDRANHPPIGRLRVDERLEFGVQLEPGATLVLYSDGLIERRYRDITAGLDLLEASVTASIGLGVADLADRLVTDPTDDDHDDDAIVLVLRWSP